MNSAKVRTRATNFTPTEAVNLLKIIEKHKKTIENKKTDKVSIADKLKAWMSVAREYNATNCGVSRTVLNLQNAYKNIKKMTKKAYSSDKMTMPLTQELVQVVLEVGEDWPAPLSQVVGAPENECELQFVNLKKEANKQLSREKKAIMGTGGGPPETDEDNALDGSYSQYDGDRLSAEPYIEDCVEAIIQAEAVGEMKETFENKQGNLKRKKKLLIKNKIKQKDILCHR